MTVSSGHVPVLLNEVLAYLNVAQGKKFIDATVGNGGHSLAIAQSSSHAKILGIDLDQASLDNLQSQVVQKGLDQRIKLVQGNYKDIDKIQDQTGFGLADGILLDLGFSSVQLADPTRGFSFQEEAPLDMRYDQNARLTALEVVSQYHPKELEQVLSEYGEEKFARRIASEIIRRRKTTPVKTTLQLGDAIRAAVPAALRFKANDNIRRVFQAIRIEVNHELNNLKEFLLKALDLLSLNGRLVVISFHSLEDRIVKEFLNVQAKDCVCPPEFPTCVCDKASRIRILTRKPVVAGSEELLANPRSKPAKLRACEKI
ncbi:MAG: 16S rRNA (cytosine(1402)-N(4))-methyltransferase [Candidatus Doudnabacteria bacterium RIFCSPHIGHO2_01_FULL_45_18]|uniref:Ribosomal RNA small subunit methyltransferase H n=1 Tax=Candidatus Doudnabacteria bacterium RIFCSPHIGHO2_01_FULL_45_18 TaxID=1817823 RepID=A0A1F5NQV4_9BACT|nr:MAG: 16S rRNA (cytosine(1402)-N(4))-methyltransferase [Candidatus Doudnabacteria bacterium RIFCSPHIGHO2_01_FULL_45_18]